MYELRNLFWKFELTYGHKIMTFDKYKFFSLNWNFINH